MASTYVNNLRVAEPATGDSDWGASTNTSLELIGEALGIGTEAITTNADTHTSTVADGASDQARAIYLKYTGTLDSACTITIGPNTMKRFQIIENATSGSQSIVIKQGSGATVTIGTGAVKAVYLDGAGAGAAVADALVDLDLTGTTTAATLTASGVITGSTVEATGDTSAGDNAAMGYTGTEGLILTGQGSTNDVTIKNDADADVLEIPTGTTNVTVVGTLGVAGGSTNGVEISQGDIALKNGGTQSTVKFYCESSNAHYVQIQAPAHSAFDGNKTLTLPASTDTLVGKATTDTLTNKTLTTPTITTPVVNAGLQLKNGATSAGFIEFFEDSDNGTNKVTLIGPASTADITITLPDSADTLVGKATTDTLTNKTLTTPVVNAGLQLKNAASSAGFIEFFEDSDNGTNKVTLIGPESTADVTITLPASADTLVGKATTDTLTNKTLTTPTITTPVINAGAQLKNGATSAGFLEFFEDSDNGTNKVTLIGPASTSDITLTLPSSDGDAGQALTTDGSGNLSFASAGGAYTAWSVKTGAYTATSADQLIANSGSAFTITLPASPSAGNTVVIHNAGAGTVTVGRNSEPINSTAEDGTLTTNSSTQLVYVDGTIGWKDV